MRIIAGEFRGRTIEAPQGRDTRPTTDRVRESVMSSVYSATGGFDGLRVLDAFSGSGAMGLEAVSRGASFALLNDGSADARAVLERNAGSLGCLPGRAKISSIDVLRSGLPQTGAPYDIVFLDPPYKTAQRDVLELVANGHEAGLLSDGCLIVYEHDEPIDEALVEGIGMRLRSERKLGKTYVSYLSLA